MVLMHKDIPVADITFSADKRVPGESENGIALNAFSISWHKKPD